MLRRILRKTLPDSFFQRPTRLDHSRMYICVTFGLWITSLSLILVGPVPNSTISNLNEFTQMSMAGVIFVGTSIKLHGIISGTRFYKPNRDPRDYYSQAKWAAVATNVSMGVYVWSIFNYYGDLLLSTMGGSLGLFIVIGGFWTSWDFANEIDRLNTHFHREVNGSQ